MNASAIPESPRYLVVSGKRDKALSVLTRLYGAAFAERKVVEIDQSLAADHHRPKLRDLLQPETGKVRKIVWVGIGLAAFQQLVGINVVFYYGAVLWQSVGFSENDALLINVVSGTLSIGACLLAIALIDRIGRKPLLWIGSVGMTITLGLAAVAFSTATTEGPSFAKLKVSIRMHDEPGVNTSAPLSIELVDDGTPLEIEFFVNSSGPGAGDVVIGYTEGIFTVPGEGLSVFVIVEKSEVEPVELRREAEAYSRGRWSLTLDLAAPNQPATS